MTRKLMIWTLTCLCHHLPPSSLWLTRGNTLAFLLFLDKPSRILPQGLCTSSGLNAFLPGYQHEILMFIFLVLMGLSIVICLLPAHVLYSVQRLFMSFAHIFVVGVFC